MMPGRIAITGLGAVTAYGESPEALWRGLAEGTSAIRPIGRFDTAGARSHLGALVADFNPRRWIPPSLLRRLDLASRFAVPAAAQALEQAAPASTDRIGVVLGTNSAGSVPVAEFLQAMSAGGPAAAPPILFPYTVANAPASQCALILGLRGPNMTVAQKEGSSTSALSVACRILASGGAEGIVAGGAEDLSVHVFEVFDRLGVLSRDLTATGGGPEGSRPFDRTRNGFVCGEGACFLFLETEQAARSRGARPVAYIEGTGDGRSPVAPHRFPVASTPLASAVRRSLAAAGIEPDGIDAIFASADSTQRLDAVEASALREVFGPRVPRATSVRGGIGECGVGGAASALAACAAIREGRLPGTIGLTTSDESLGLDVAPAMRGISARRVLVTGIASGGGASALVLGAP